ncbi:MAG: hypothetical protein M0R66_05395 [Candidatus Omnitrophica bacterium]|nr:hypothetical protein [Candidatus Omnitrophota bacterium]
MIRARLLLRRNERRGRAFFESARADYMSAIAILDEAMLGRVALFMSPRDGRDDDLFIIPLEAVCERTRAFILRRAKIMADDGRQNQRMRAGNEKRNPLALAERARVVLRIERALLRSVGRE